MTSPSTDRRLPRSALAQPRGALGDGVEDRLRSVGEEAITRRTSAVAVCCSSASVTCGCSPELGVALLQLLEQPRVLDGDDGLVGERLQQRDLLSVNGRTSFRRNRRSRRSPRRRGSSGTASTDR